MVFPGVIRKLNKNLPALLQTIMLICIIHYVGQGVLLKVEKKLRFGRFAKLADTAAPKALSGHGVSGDGAGGNWKGKGSSKFGGGFIRNHKLSSSTSTTTTTTTTTPVPALEDEIMMQEQQRRLELLHRACARWNIGLWSHGEPANLTAEEKTALSILPKSPLFQALFVSEKHHLAVCPMARTGIQWLARRLLQLTGKYDARHLLRLQEPPSAIARHNFPYLSSWEKYPTVLSQSVTILMARHPFDRLLASYRYLLEDPERNPHGYLHYGRRIVRTYRQAPGHGKGPLFEEFVQFLLGRDMHHMEEAWQPVTRRCTPCHIQYNFISHYETLWHDAQWAWKKVGLVGLNTTDYFQYSLSPEVRRQYFSELTLAQVLQLYSKYKLDFELFGYSLEEHMAYAKPGDEPVDPALMANLPPPNADKLQVLLDDAMEKAKVNKEYEIVGERQAPPPASGSSSVGLSLDNDTIVEVDNDIADTGNGNLLMEEK